MLKLKKKNGQATVELALFLPFVVWLIFYTINAYQSMHTAHVAQTYAAMSLYQRLSWRAKFVVDEADIRAINREFMAVRYENAEGGTPQRKIISGANPIDVVVGICREPRCN